MTTSFKRLTFGILIAAAAGILASAPRRPIKVMEASVETTAGLLSLPSSVSGLVSAQACVKCAAQTFHLDAHATLFLNGREVSLREMSGALAKSRNAPVSVHYRLADSLVTRILFVQTP